MEVYLRKIIHYISIISLACSIGGILSVVLFVLAPFGHLIVAAIYLFKAGLVLGIISTLAIVVARKEVICLVFSILAIIIAAPAIYLDHIMERSVKDRQEAEKSFSGEYNLRLLGKELIKYAKDHDGYLPLAEKWCDQLMDYNKSLTRENFIHPMYDDPKLKLKGACHFAFNKNLGGMKISDLPDDIVFLFESDGDWNLNGCSELLNRRYRKYGYIPILFFNQKMENYWFDYKAYKKYDSGGKGMFYEKLRWEP